MLPLQPDNFPSGEKGPEGNLMYEHPGDPGPAMLAGGFRKDEQ